MISLRNVLGLLTASFLLTLALPASAANPEKIYSMVVTQPAAGKVKITIKNETPDGNSTINSIFIQGPNGVTLDTPKATRGATTVSPITIPPPTGGKIYVNAFDGLKAANKSPSYIEINLNATPLCGEFRWTAKVYTGNSFGVEEFAQVLPGTTTKVSPPGWVQKESACTLKFDPPPVGFKSGTAVTPTVGLTASIPWDGSVVWTLNSIAGSSGSVSGGDPVAGCATPPCLTYTYPDLTITSSSPTGSLFTLTAATSLGSVSADTSITSDQFASYPGILNCYPTPPFKDGNLDPGDPLAYVLQTDEGQYGLVRGANKDGVDCVPVPYLFELNVNATPKQTAKFIVPPGTGQGVAVEYVVVWKAVKVVATLDEDKGWTINRPKLAWKTCAATVGTCTIGQPAYIPALSCVKDPAEFGDVLWTDLDGLLPRIPNVAPFNTEPYSTYYPVGEKAKMCVAQQGWTSVAPPVGDTSGSVFVRYWTKVIDQGDGFMTND